jgi:NAD(P)-dependent dehydrogenase (short-subunit alcohol dehydrogenase family)
VCNNAGVASRGDPWFGPTAAWTWVLGVNLWGVIHGIRAFLPHLVAQGEGHIVNTASVAGLIPGFGPSYDATKHAVVAVSEDLYSMTKTAGLAIGVSALCPGWVRTSIVDADRNWPAVLGPKPDRPAAMEVLLEHYRRAIDEGATPAAVADLVAQAVEADRFWVFTQPAFIELAARRWHTIAEGLDPDPALDMPGVPPGRQMIEEVRAALAAAVDGGPAGSAP